MLEEPELSLHAGVVRHIPAMMARAGRKAGRQIILSTHSRELLLDKGIGAEEVVLLVPSQEATQAVLAASDRQPAQCLRPLVEGDLDEAVLRRLAAEASLLIGTVYGKNGKDDLDRRLAGYNNAARFAPWIVLRDLEHDAECAPVLRSRLPPERHLSSASASPCDPPKRGCSRTPRISRGI